MIARASSCALAALLSGCAQLVAFGQPVIGQPDVVEVEAGPGGPLCDAEIAVGESAVCDASCVIEEGAEECPRVERTERGARVDVSGLREVEITARACASGARPLVVTGENGASVSIEEGALVVRPAREAAARPVRRTGFVPEGECEDRALVLQTGRMELAEGGVRLCSPHLVPVGGSWTIEVGEGLLGLELCFRAR